MKLATTVVMNDESKTAFENIQLVFQTPPIILARKHSFLGQSPRSLANGKLPSLTDRDA